MKKGHNFCETPNENCTMNYCDENGCQNREISLAEPIPPNLEVWQIELNCLDKIRLELGLNWNQLEKLTGKSRNLLQKYFSFKSVPSLKVYFELKTALENEFEVKYSEVVAPEFPEDRKDYTLTAFFSKKSVKAEKGVSAKEAAERIKSIVSIEGCDCKIENGLFKRGKIKCSKTKAQHKF